MGKALLLAAGRQDRGGDLDRAGETLDSSAPSVSIIDWAAKLRRIFSAMAGVMGGSSSVPA